MMRRPLKAILEEIGEAAEDLKKENEKLQKQQQKAKMRMPHRRH